MTARDDVTQLNAGLARLGLTLGTAQRDALIMIASEVSRANAALGLISRRDERRVVERHVLDSLELASGLVDANCDLVVDVGSGAGFPGLPLAVALPDLGFVLLERNRKKARFIIRTAALLGLDNVTVRADDARHYVNVMDEPLEGRDAHMIKPAESHVSETPRRSRIAVVSRAVAEPERIWDLVAGAFEQRGGVLLLMTGVEHATPDEPAFVRSNTRLSARAARAIGGGAVLTVTVAAA